MNHNPSAPGSTAKSKFQVVTLTAKCGRASWEVCANLCSLIADRRFPYSVLPWRIDTDEGEPYEMDRRRMEDYVRAIANRSSDSLQPYTLILPDVATPDQFTTFPNALRVALSGTGHDARFSYTPMTPALEKMVEAGLFDMVLDVDKVKPLEAAREILNRVRSHWAK